MYADHLRNLAIIAHVDHGKTSLVDVMLRQSGAFRSNEQVEERVMDSNDLEKERGITILAKNTSVNWQGVKINIVDTPGHADFGGEVERVLKMVDGVLLVVDAFEGPMPQTKFVLRKALELDLKPIVVINKVDRPEARPYEVVDEVLELFMQLGASDEQLDFPIVYTSARQGNAGYEPGEMTEDLVPLFETILREIPAPECDPDSPLQMLATTLDYNDYLGKIAIGRVFRGKLTANTQVAVIKRDGSIEKVKVGKVFTFQNLGRVDVLEANAGDIVAISGIPNINIGETIADPLNPEPLPMIEIDEPTLTMLFMVNTGPFAGTEGKHITSRKLRERLFKEIETNVSLRVEETENMDCFQVSGRGELHLSILIENMRREGFELMVSKPEVILKEIDGVKCEPFEHLTCDIPDSCTGTVIEMLGTRKAEMQNMVNMSGGVTRLEFLIPARGLIGFRGDYLTETRGEGIMAHVFHSYQPYKGDIQGRNRGVLVASDPGESTAYALFQLQDRGRMFIDPGTKVYEGMIVGQSNREQDIDINIARKKQLTNMRSSGADESLRLEPAKLLGLEEALEYINDDEYVEITPINVRLRKRFLDKNTRTRYEKQKNMSGI
ncbi:GTP-binding protein TypA [Dehalobacter sp. UNSWDHB]|jgi:GTP-binding protein TypA/BipA|uniref:translational GTPase TypA n=1 Tax=unclassified Dehalobacter TaxID=2635733 RepID=UPI00028B41B0|nr:MULTISPECIES: translational GTPase TypA [unclassified Dehalobacter]AFV02758.1 GTP-binding protein TypA/BipA [Dehalobacter sp. DCA]AFV05743.1 GTP-binding protein TypA/BipA [Dehalobacter sp. CF]EQB21064.1 GTP-binding protein TypA [Dehalobacter sp. UNSWDHB]